ncbi:histidinol-phosphate transaminase [Ereboglobus sp. PH5-5]|uniref:histidinol-phosphate transaminase n=1 Tax=Ereboglobus sp. PH5-5 TaxID=2940529 RepID=UPI0024049178|nr:histidinol-phosphate transaminase [Ereboglobus sp. PH5-5]
MSNTLPQPLPHIAKLHAYTPGLQPTESGWIKLNTNECPHPPSPRVAGAIIRELGEDKFGANLRLYPNPTSAALRETIAAHHAPQCPSLTAAGVCVGNGSDDILNLLVRAYCSAGAPLAHTVPSYSLYPVLVAIENGRCETIPFERDMRLPVETLAASTAPIIFLTSPNAPTGVGFANAEIERILAGYRGLLVVDEAYAPFANENAVPLLARHPNLVIVRTLSKAHALAGIRIGYALAHPEVIGVLDRVRDSYNTSRLSQAAAIAALEDAGYYAGIIEKIKTTRDHWQKEWTARGWFSYPSQTNFIFVEPKNARGESGAAVAQSAYDWLRAHKVLVRYFPSHPLTAPFLRISVGTDTEMVALDNTLQAWIKNA